MAATLVGVVAAHVVGPLGVVVATAFEVVFIFVFAEAAPKTWAVQNTERAALLAAPVVIALVKIPPIRWITNGLISVSNLILPGKGIKQGPFVSEEELLAMADAAAQDDVIEREERTLIHSIIDFGDTVVREVMVPRPDMVAVESTARVSDVVEIAIAAGYSRIPVFGQGIDDIVGVVFIKDLMRAEREGKQDAARLADHAGAVLRARDQEGVGAHARDADPEVPPGRSWSTSTAAPPGWWPWRT